MMAKLSIKIDKTVADGVLDEFCAVMKAELGHHMGAVSLDGRWADKEPFGNFLAGAAVGHQA